MAVLTAVPLRLWRAYVLTHGPPYIRAWVGGTFQIALLFLKLKVTIHLGNYTLRSWTWRAPVFALLESGTEILMSLALTRRLDWNRSVQIEQSSRTGFQRAFAH